MNRAERRRQQQAIEKAGKRAKSGRPASPSTEQRVLTIGQRKLTVGQAIDLAVQQHSAGRLMQAENIYQQILIADPGEPVALHLLGVIAYQAEKYDIAVDRMTKAVAIEPDYAEAHNNLGVVFKKLGRLNKAVVSYHKALAIKPAYSDAEFNLGTVYQELGRLDEAAGSYQKTIAITPNHFEAHNNLGVVLKNLGRLDEAVASYHKALAIKPDHANAHNNIAYVENYRTGVSLQKLESIHAAWEKQFGVPLQKEWRDHDNMPDPEGRLRIGFVSPDLGRHPVGYFLSRLLQHRQENETEFLCYSDRRPDDLAERLMELSDEWTDVRGVSDEALAQRIRSDRVDILIDLAGHTAMNRLLVFARKPAPIQATWAGYVGSTGLSAMDYLIADRWHVPEGAEQHYLEKVVRLPDGYICYEPPDYAPPVGPLPFEQNNIITFGCFNNPAKINNLVLSTWSEILNRVPNSQLILKYKNMDAEGNRTRIIDYFSAQGIEKSRFILEGNSPHADLLARYNQVDIALDTFPYSGGLTTCEALWMGVPIITNPGETFASRHSLSHLSNIGAPEFVADDLSDYASRAVELANDVVRLTGLRSGLREQMASSALCDGAMFATNFASVMRQIWREWCFKDDTDPNSVI